MIVFVKNGKGVMRGHVFCGCFIPLVALVMAPLLFDFIWWFSWQWYFFVLWAALVFFVALAYRGWWWGLGRLGIIGRFWVGALWTVGWFWLVSLLWCWAYGGSDGLFLMHPCLLLLSFGWMRALVFFVTWEGACFLLFSFFFGVEYMLWKKWWWGVIFFVLGLIGFVGVLHKRWVALPPHPFDLQVVAPRLSFCYQRSPDILARAQVLVHGVEAPRDALVLFPEATLPGKLLEDKRVLALLETVSNGCAVVVGGHVAGGNAAFCFIDGALVGWRVKGHAMPFFERIPIGSVWLKALFEHAFGSEPFCGSDEGLVTVWRYGTHAFSVFLCSEFFFKELVRELPREVFPLVLVHDGWFCCSYIGSLLWCMAAAKVLKNHRALGYVSYQCAGMFDAEGRWFIW